MCNLILKELRNDDKFPFTKDIFNVSQKMKLNIPYFIVERFVANYMANQNSCSSCLNKLNIPRSDFFKIGSIVLARLNYTSQNEINNINNLYLKKYFKERYLKTHLEIYGSCEKYFDEIADNEPEFSKEYLKKVNDKINYSNLNMTKRKNKIFMISMPSEIFFIKKLKLSYYQAAKHSFNHNTERIELMRNIISDYRLKNNKKISKDSKYNDMIIDLATIKIQDAKNLKERNIAKARRVHKLSYQDYKDYNKFKIFRNTLNDENKMKLEIKLMEKEDEHSQVVEHAEKLALFASYVEYHNLPCKKLHFVQSFLMEEIISEESIEMYHAACEMRLRRVQLANLGIYEGKILLTEKNVNNILNKGNTLFENINPSYIKKEVFSAFTFNYEMNTLSPSRYLKSKILQTSKNRIYNYPLLKKYNKIDRKLFDQMYPLVRSIRVFLKKVYDYEIDQSRFYIEFTELENEPWYESFVEQMEEIRDDMYSMKDNLIARRDLNYNWETEEAYKKSNLAHENSCKRKILRSIKEIQETTEEEFLENCKETLSNFMDANIGFAMLGKKAKLSDLEKSLDDSQIKPLMMPTVNLNKERKMFLLAKKTKFLYKRASFWIKNNKDKISTRNIEIFKETRYHFKNVYFDGNFVDNFSEAYNSRSLD
jgi:hypothetical protein